MRVLDRRIVSKGDISFPCIPALGTQYAEKLCSAWSALGRKFSDTEAAQLRTALTDVLTKGYNITPHATVLVSYEADPPPNAQLRYHLQVVGQTVAE